MNKSVRHPENNKDGRNQRTTVMAYFFHASACVGRAFTVDESVMNVLEHFDQNGEGKTRDLFEAVE